MTGKLNRRNSGFFEGVDWLTVGLYLTLIVVGFFSIMSSSYKEEDTQMFSLSTNYMKQAIWMGIACVVGVIILLLDGRYFHMYAYPAYLAGLGLLIFTLLFGKEVNGAKAWIELGSFRLQPVELAKIGTALAVARAMSAYHFSIERLGGLIHVGFIIALPLLIIVLQNDTGSGVVLCSFIFVLYREGLNKWLCIPMIVMALLFLISFILSPATLLILVVGLCIFCEAMISRQWRSRIIYALCVALGTLFLYSVCHLFAPGKLSYYAALLITTLLSLVAAGIYAYRANMRHIFLLVGIVAGSILFLHSTDMVFNHLKDHQQKRILSYVGIIDDPQGIDFNVNQAKIAIGSGGLTGKGFLKGTQIKYGFVPERHTDFIFCSIGEEHGFVGTALVLTLFCALILRLLHMGERQQEPFGRIYCYCVAAILLFHVMVNVGMTISLVPVMGIPLPFVSYGGSSLVAFTMLLFIAIRLDASTRRFSIAHY